jgi:hypothetical protein
MRDNFFGQIIPYGFSHNMLIKKLLKTPFQKHKTILKLQNNFHIYSKSKLFLTLEKKKKKESPKPPNSEERTKIKCGLRLR